MATTKVRQSNIELLRIVAIFLVMVGHINAGMGGGMPVISGEWEMTTVGRNIVGSLASICVVLFVLISGYFSIKPNLKSITTIWTQFFFVNLYMYVLQAIMGEASLKGLMSCFLPFTFGNWFVRAYLLLMLLSPALNLLAEKMTRKGWYLFLCIFLMMGFLWGCISPTDAAGFNKGLSPISLSLVYMVGRFIKTQMKLDNSKWFYMGGYLACSLLIFIGLIFNQRWVLYYCNPVLILSAVSLFIFFVKWDIGYNKFINWVATSVFAVFVFHTHAPLSGILTDYNIQLLHTIPYMEYLVIMLLGLTGLFMIAVLLDKVRGLIFKPVINYVNRIVILSDNCDKLISFKKE